MPIPFVRKLLHLLLLSHYSLALDSDSLFDPLNGLDTAPPISFATAENGFTGNLVAASNIGLTEEPMTDPQASDLFNSQANPDKLSQLSEANSTPCLPKMDLSPNRRRRGKREEQYCNSNLFVAPGAGKKPTAPTGSQDQESGQQHTDETDESSSRRESGKTPSSSAQDEKKEPSADRKAGSSNKSPCNEKNFIYPLCSPMSAVWQIGSSDPQRSRLILGAANVWFPPGCLEPDLAWCCKSMSPRSVVLPTYETYLFVGGKCLPQDLLNFMRRMNNF